MTDMQEGRWAMARGADPDEVLSTRSTLLADLTTVSYSRAITLLTRAGGGSHYSFRFERSIHRGHHPHAKGTSHIRRNHRK